MTQKKKVADVTKHISILIGSHECLKRHNWSNLRDTQIILGDNFIGN